MSTIKGNCILIFGAKGLRKQNKNFSYYLANINVAERRPPRIVPCYLRVQMCMINTDKLRSVLVLITLEITLLTFHWPNIVHSPLNSLYPRAPVLSFCKQLLRL